jgi:hypothetical protein
MAKALNNKNAKFSIEQRIIIDKITPNVSLWSIPEPLYTSTLLPVKHKWETAWNEYNLNPAIRIKNYELRLITQSVVIRNF